MLGIQCCSPRNFFESKREFSDIESRDVHLTIYRSLPKMYLRIESFMLKLADVESSVLGKRRFPSQIVLDKSYIFKALLH